MNIRRAMISDMPGINKLLNQVLMVHHNGRPDLFKSNVKKYTDEELAEIIENDKKPIFVAVDESDEVLGYAFCVYQQHINDNILTDVRTLYIDDLCVDENKRGLHIGKQLYEYVVDFNSLDDAELQRYVQDNIYNELVAQLDSDEYFVENVSAVYISQEYIDELTYNSKPNVYFGYTLEEIDAVYQGTRYVFTMSEEGDTIVVPFEEYDDTFEQVIKNVAIVTGVILICVTV